MHPFLLSPLLYSKAGFSPAKNIFFYFSLCRMKDMTPLISSLPLLSVTSRHSSLSSPHMSAVRPFSSLPH